MARKVGSGTRIIGAFQEPEGAPEWAPAQAAKPAQVGRNPRGPQATRAPKPTKTPKPAKRSALRWVVGGASLFALGVGAAIGISALRDDGASVGPSPSASAPMTAPPSVTVAPPVAEPPLSNPGALRPEPRETKPAPVEAKTLPAWAETVARSNAWVAVAAADGPHRLGISDEAATGELSARMTGFWPGLNVQAPSAAFAIQQHEVSWAELEAAGDSVGGLAGLHRPSWVPADAAKRANLPATGVPWHVARAWCRAVGGDLPSEAQWEWAARGPDARPFPWGRDALDTTRIRIQLKRPIPVAAVGTSPQDVTPGAEPVRDLLGNAQEWTRDAWTPSRPGETVDKGDAPHHRAVRGWPLTERGARLPAEGASYRQAMCVTGACDQDAAATDLVGFRCVKPLP